MASSPTSLGVAIDLAESDVHPDADRTYECHFTQTASRIRSETVWAAAMVIPAG
jgi:hypothetical protein